MTGRICGTVVATEDGKPVPPNLWGHWAVEHVEPFATEEAARAAGEASKDMVDFIGYRVLTGEGKPPRLAVCYEDCGAEAAKHLPDGSRRVMLTPAMVRLFGLVKDTKEGTG